MLFERPYADPSFDRLVKGERTMTKRKHRATVVAAGVFCAGAMTLPAEGRGNDVVKPLESTQEARTSDSAPPPPPKPATAASPAQLLSSVELAEVARRSEEPGQEVVGGALSNLHLTYIVIALAAALLVILVK
jgi:hypothetical protein